MEVEQMTNTATINLGELELDVEVEFEVDGYNPGSCTEPPSGPAIYIMAVWLGVGQKRVDVLAALDSLDDGLEDAILEQLEEQLERMEEQEPDADHAMELARDREMDL
jgi:hypothetical protein|tara:strand:+ start:468 stop:791 length:324 start_codon:yes stop_codon:yes gene_type:complete